MGVTDDRDVFAPLRAEAADASKFIAPVGLTVQIAPEVKRLKLRCESTANGLKLRFSGFKPGSELWCNYPMGAELTRTREITTTDFAWVRGSFMILSDANHYYTADLERTRLSGYFWDQGRYDLTIVPDEGMDLAAAGRELAQFELPPLDYAVAGGGRLMLAGPTIDSDRIHLQALIPGNDTIQLRALNSSDKAATARVGLPAGWRLGAQVDAHGTPYHEQPRGETIHLGPWEFGTFVIARKR